MTPAPAIPLRRRRPPRRGSAYVFFLMVSTLVTVIGLSALMVTRIERRGIMEQNDAVAARFHAKSAIDLGFIYVARHADWRHGRGAGQWLEDEPIGDGAMSLTVAFGADGDGDPDNDPVIMTGQGMQGNAVHKTEVTLTIQDGSLAVAPEGWRRVVD